MISAKTEQNWPKVGQLAAKQRTWFNQNDGVAGTPIVWYEGLAYLSMQDYPKAVEKLELAKQYSPWHPQVLSNLGVALYLNNQQEKGIQQLEDLLLLYPDFEDVRMNLCEIYLTRGNKDARVIELISYWKTHTGNPKYDGYYAKIAAFLLERSQHDTPNQQQE